MTPKFSSRSFLKQWGLIHISVYSAVTGMGWESGVKTRLKDKTFSPPLLFFFASVHLKAIVCIFSSCQLKDNYVMFSDIIVLTSDWRRLN